MKKSLSHSFASEHALLNMFPGLVPAHSCPARQRAPRRERNDAIGGFSSAPISRFPEGDHREPLIENRLTQLVLD